MSGVGEDRFSYATMELRDHGAAPTSPPGGVLQQLGLPLRGVCALTSSELPWAVQDCLLHLLGMGLRRFVPKGGILTRPFTVLIRVPKGKFLYWKNGNEFDSCPQGVSAMSM